MHNFQKIYPLNMVLLISIKKFWKEKCEFSRGDFFFSVNYPKNYRFCSVCNARLHSQSAFPQSLGSR